MACKDDFIEHAITALPAWFSQEERNFEVINAFAEIFCDIEDIGTFWKNMSYILLATKDGVDGPDWLDQHARDRGTTRQPGETDEALRARLRNPGEALTKSAIEDSIQNILDSEGIVGTASVFELRPNAAFFQDLQAQTGTGGTFGTTTDAKLFQPDAGFGNLAIKYDSTASHQLVISGANEVGNNGTFPITGVFADSVTYDNASAVAEVDAGATWTINRLDASGNVLDGFAQSYMDRGYRFSTSQNAAIVVILPLGCTSGTLASVQEALRQTGGAGVFNIVECYDGP